MARDKGLAEYERTLSEVAGLIDQARRTAARALNAILTASYWAVGRRIVEEEQHGATRAGYGEALVERLARDLSKRYGRGFGRSNLWQMRTFYLAYPTILQTASGESDALSDVAARFPLPWSHYVRLLSVQNVEARSVYEAEALRGGWTVRQLDRQVSSQFYERTALSRNKAAMLQKGQRSEPGDEVSPEQEIKDPFILEFLGLKDEYSESDLEEGLVTKLESLLLEMGGGFAFVGRQRRLRIGDEWYRIDLLFFHRRLRCLVVIDLKLGRFSHADAGQMHLYLNYAREHWMVPGENPPVGLILCASKDAAVVRYALDGLPNKVLAAEYRTTLPDEKLLASEITRTRHELEARRAPPAPPPKPGRKRVRSTR